MTREKRTKLIRHLRYNRSIGADYLITDEDADEIIKALEQEPCDDCISRQAAIEVLRNRWLKTRNYDGIGEDIAGECEIYLKTLPSAQPERKTGKWTYGEDEYGIDSYHCDKCGFFVPWDYTHKFIDFIKDYHFCPNCGAKMESEDVNND